MARIKGHRTGAKIIETGLLIVLPVLFHVLFPVMILISKPYTYFGSIIMLLGLALMTWAARLFQDVGRGFHLHVNSPALVTLGPFRFSRNPIYLGMLVWLIGLAILLGSLIAFIFPVLFFVLTEFFIIPFEERSMEQLFGAQFNEYKKRVRRWF